MTKKEIIDYCEMKSQLEPKNEDVYNYIIKALEQEPCTGSVNRATVLDLINDVQRADGFNDYAHYEYLFDNVNNMPSVTPTQRWIPCSEGLPKESLNSVIGWDAYRERCVFVQYIDGHFQITGRNESFNIVAWQPLPKPYKEKSEE